MWRFKRTKDINFAPQSEMTPEDKLKEQQRLLNQRRRYVNKYSGDYQRGTAIANAMERHEKQICQTSKHPFTPSEKQTLQDFLDAKDTKEAKTLSEKIRSTIANIKKASDHVAFENYLSTKYKLDLDYCENYTKGVRDDIMLIEHQCEKEVNTSTRISTAQLITEVRNYRQNLENIRQSINDALDNALKSAIPKIVVQQVESSHSASYPSISKISKIEIK